MVTIWLFKFKIYSYIEYMDIEIFSKAAINDYVHFWIICGLFFRLFIPWNVKKVWKAHISISQSQKWHLLSKQQPKTQRLLNY